jgi:type IV pilus assembly protein PilO
MLSTELLGQFWRSHRSMLIVLAVLVVLNLALYAALENLLVPKVAEQELLFIQRQSEVRQILRNQEGVAKTPEHLFVLARQDLTEFQEVVPDYQDFTGLIEELVTLASMSELALTHISYSSNLVKEVELLHFKLSFNLSGEYAQIKRFIHSLEQSKRLITISGISLQGADKGGVSLRLQMETHFHPGRVAS